MRLRIFWNTGRERPLTAIRRICKKPENQRDGAPGEIRTPDPQVRSLMLYPTELRARRRGILQRYPHSRHRRGTRERYGEELRPLPRPRAGTEYSFGDGSSAPDKSGRAAGRMGRQLRDLLCERPARRTASRTGSAARLTSVHKRRPQSVVPWGTPPDTAGADSDRGRAGVSGQSRRQRERDTTSGACHSDSSRVLRPTLRVL